MHVEKNISQKSTTLWLMDLNFLRLDLGSITELLDVYTLPSIQFILKRSTVAGKTADKPLLILQSELFLEILKMISSALDKPFAGLADLINLVADFVGGDFPLCSIFNVGQPKLDKPLPSSNPAKLDCGDSKSDRKSEPQTFAQTVFRLFKPKHRQSTGAVREHQTPPNLSYSKTLGNG